MRMSWCWPSRAEDRFESWLAQRHEERVLAGETTPVGPCPDETFLWDLSRKAKRIDLSDPRVDHAANCSTCMSRLLVFRQGNRSRRRKLVLATAVALCTVTAAIVITIDRYGMHRQLPSTELAVQSEAVNLWDAGTIRGNQPGSLQSVSLPAALVRLTIILPRFSPPGQYAVAVTQDQNGDGVVAQRSALTTTNGDHESVSVELDLRAAKAGAYFLATTHEQDQASYYYPLQIK
jgi:hypothetical protein